uniref:Uncharacterized protein n=1 Tax=Anguilla anguilla TaxID=7936 RepID=A0A0E9U7X9_ANGAN
MFYVASLVT